MCICVRNVIWFGRATSATKYLVGFIVYIFFICKIYMTTRKNRKSKKRNVRKKRKYTQKGRGLFEDSKKAISSAAKKQVSKYTRGHLKNVH